MELEKKLKGSFLSPYKIVKPYFEKQKPQTIEVHPSYPCNYNCEWCIDKTLKEIGVNKDSKSMMTKENVEEIIRFCKAQGVKGIIISGGGEPTLNKNTELLVKLAKENNIVIGLFTNGSMLNSENIPTYINSCSFIRFSFDDFSPESYAKTKGVPERYYDLVLNNISNCVAYKILSENDKCRIGIDFILIPSNITKMVWIYEEALTLGVDYLQFCDCVEIGYEFTQRRKKEIRKGLKEVMLHKKEIGDTQMDVVYEPIQMENYIPCGHCKVIDYIFQVGADGGVRPCPHSARRDDWLYGNINEHSLEYIWTNRPTEKIDKEYLYENCRFKKQNEILFGLERITHGEMI